MELSLLVVAIMIALIVNYLYLEYKDTYLKYPEKMIGKRIKGFIFFSQNPLEISFSDEMEDIVGEIGKVIKYDDSDGTVLIDFPNKDSYWFPAQESVKHIIR